MLPSPAIHIAFENFQRLVHDGTIGDSGEAQWITWRGIPLVIDTEVPRDRIWLMGSRAVEHIKSAQRLAGYLSLTSADVLDGDRFGFIEEAF